MPDTIPVLPIVAISSSSLLHVPPVVVVLNAVVEPTHTEVVPVITAGNALTVITADLLQPSPEVNVIADVPLAIPVTIPEDGSTVAFVVLPEVHVPPETDVDSSRVCAWLSGALGLCRVPLQDDGLLGARTRALHTLE